MKVSTSLTMNRRAELRLRLLLVIAIGAPLLAWTAIAEDQRPDTAAAVSSPRQTPLKPGQRVYGDASWYGPGLQGKPTSSGEVFDSHKLTAASTKVPLGTTAQVKNLENGRKVVVKVNDCGPHVKGRSLDLSSGAADKLKMKHDGVVPVEVKVLNKPDDAQLCTHR
jgi:peptidoglycan lytic transglycosylase